MVRRNQLILLGITVVTLAISGFFFYQGFTSANKPTQVIEKEVPYKDEQVLGQENSGTLAKDSFKVLKVVDGDTIEIDYYGQEISVRFIGVDTPETVDPRRPVGCFGKEASDENKRLLQGKVVELEKDISETDKYGRLLRYVYLRLDDNNLLFVNDYLIRQGFGQALSYPPDVKFNDRFLEAQKEAREESRGLWQKC